MSSRLRFFILAIAGLAVLAMAGALSRQDPGERNVRFFPEMFHGPAQETFSPSAIFANGRTQQQLVEGVVEGRMQVDRYDLAEREGDRMRFECVESSEAGVGSSGSLIPPYEYHVLSNRLADRHSVTLHVYGGEMDHCRIYRPVDAGGWYSPVERALTYDEA